MSFRSCLFVISLASLTVTACTSGDSSGGQGGRGGGAGAVPSSCVDCGPTNELLFDNTRVAEVRLTFDPIELQGVVDELRRQGHEEALDTWIDVLWAKWKHCAPYTNHVPVTMEYRSPDRQGDVVLNKVGMRLRGTKSKGRNEVQGFKLEFQPLLGEPALGQRGRRFGGENKLSLLSVEGDHSLAVQCVAYDMVRAFGDVPAPRCNHLKIYVNDIFYALIQNVEEVDDGPFRKNFFKKDEDNGTLYECSGGCGYDDSKADLEYHGDVFEVSADPNLPANVYPKAYNPVHIPGEAEKLAAGIVDPGKAEAETNLVPLFKCGDVDSTPDDEAFKACIAEWIDVQEWLKLIAAESLLPSAESFVGAKRNFYLYFKPNAAAPHGGRFVIYSWDYDAALNQGSCYPSSCDPFTAVAGWYGPAGTRAPLARRLTRVFKEQYCAVMESFLRDAFKEEIVDVYTRQLAPTLTAMPVPLADGRTTTGEVFKRDPITYEEWSTQIMKLRDYVTSHRTKAQAQVSAACALVGTP